MNSTLLVLMAAGTFLMLPTLLAVPLTQFGLRRLLSALAATTIDASRVLDIDKQAAAKVSGVIETAIAFLPAGAEGVGSIVFTRFDAYDTDGFLVRNDRLARALMTVHLVGRIINWVGRPFGGRRFDAAATALWILLFEADENGMIRSQDRFESFLNANPVEPEPFAIPA